MAAHLNNTFALKLNTPELRQDAYRQYCEHIAAGWQKKSWYYDHPTITLSWATMEKTLLDYAEEFNPEHMTIAEAKSLKHWEGILYASALGQNKEANTASLQMIFRNKFGWDKLNHNDGDAKTTTAIQHNQHLILAQLSDMQKEIDITPVQETSITPVQETDLMTAGDDDWTIETNPEPV